MKGLCLCAPKGVERKVGLVRGDPVADRIKCRSHGGKKSKMKS
jgi:hypothetical protein